MRKIIAFIIRFFIVLFLAVLLNVIIFLLNRFVLKDSIQITDYGRGFIFGALALHIGGFVKDGPDEL